MLHAPRILNNTGYDPDYSGVASVAFDGLAVLAKPCPSVAFLQTMVMMQLWEVCNFSKSWIIGEPATVMMLWRHGYELSQVHCRMHAEHPHTRVLPATDRLERTGAAMVWRRTGRVIARRIRDNACYWIWAPRCDAKPLRAEAPYQFQTWYWRSSLAILQFVLT